SCGSVRPSSRSASSSRARKPTTSSRKLWLHCLASFAFSVRYSDIYQCPDILYQYPDMPGQLLQAAWKPKHNPWLIALTVTIATFMEVLDTSIANVALPHIAGSVGASQEEAPWVM